MTELYIFGEAHTSPENIDYIAKRIREIKPKVILHELLYSDLVITDKVLKERLAKCDGSGPCDPKLNKDIYELGLELKAQLIGIDIRIRSRDLKIQFAGREEHMVNMIQRYTKGAGPVVVVVGDIHLREKDNPTLGPGSLITKTFKGKAIIERAPEHLREAE